MDTPRAMFRLNSCQTILPCDNHKMVGCIRQCIRTTGNMRGSETRKSNQPWLPRSKSDSHVLRGLHRIPRALRRSLPNTQPYSLIIPGAPPTSTTSFDTHPTTLMPLNMERKKDMCCVLLSAFLGIGDTTRCIGYCVLALLPLPCAVQTDWMDRVVEERQSRIPLSSMEILSKIPWLLLLFSLVRCLMDAGDGGIDR